MSGSTKGEDRARLDGFELDIFKLVREHATSEQWRQWLLVLLEHAAAKGGIDLFTRLMDGEKVANTAPYDQWTEWLLDPLEHAAANGFELEIFKLVRKAVAPKEWREWLRVPLEHAAENGNEDLFTRLMDAGAEGSASCRGWSGRTLLAAAAFGKSKKIVLALLLAGGKDEVNTQFGESNLSALHIAAAQGAEEVWRVLVKAGADPNLRSDGFCSRTPLHAAAEAGHHGIVGMLLSNDVLPDARTGRGKQTALHLAAMSGHELCVSELLLAGADKDSCDVYGKTPLHLAADNNHLGVVEQLLAADAHVDAHVNVLDSPSGPPLHTAASNGHVNVVRALVRHGSSLEATDSSGSTALYRAAVSGRIDRADRDNGDVIKFLLEAGADVEAKTTDGGYTPLHGAVFHHNARSGTIYALLKGGANVNVRDRAGDTSLHIACFNSCAVGVELLLRWGAGEALVNDSRGLGPAHELGRWRFDFDYFSNVHDSDEEQERTANDWRIRHMLAHAPAYRPWGRRGWLVLARSRPDRVQLVNDSRSSKDDSSTTVVWGRGDDWGGGGDGDGEQTMTDLQRLVGGVVGLDAEGVFRLVVGFL